mmetsp:Transcript_4582/g.4723  ORF Transcript_4582/g.4723 Transcript_4582/m.4723 type:complete len:319 (+) Transcript_4582:925-1881(+)
MMLASASTASYTTSAALFISCRVISGPPTMLNTIPFAFEIGKSRRGEEIALMAASTALVFPFPCPIPIKAVPALPMMVRTSAKSTLTSPGLMMISLMPTTPCLKISSATRKASVSGVFSGTIWRSLSLLTTIRVSTLPFISLIACLACCMRLRPSKPKGLVTTPTVKAPAFLAHSATIGAAPEPVPPPIPAVTKTKSASLTISMISSLLSSAALQPTEGLPPAPRPLEVKFPMFNFRGAMLLDSAWASVLTTHNSTPATPVELSIIRLTAFPPPPPTPITFIRQGDPEPSALIRSVFDVPASRGIDERLFKGVFKTNL